MLLFGFFSAHPPFAPLIIMICIAYAHVHTHTDFIPGTIAQNDDTKLQKYHKLSEQKRRYQPNEKQKKKKMDLRKN